MRIAALVALASLLSLSAAVPAQAEMRCSPSEGGKVRCTVGLGAPSLAGMMQTQRGSQWCWAAAVSMVLKSHGVEVTQEDIVKRELGEMADKPISATGLGRLLNSSWTDTSGHQREIGGDTLPPWRAGWGLTAPEVIGELQKGRPLIILGGGHAVVLVQLVVEMAGGHSGVAAGPVRLVRAVVLDPAAAIPLRSARPHEWRPEAAFRVEVRSRTAAQAS
jgi:hypothetical protein